MAPKRPVEVIELDSDSDSDDRARAVASGRPYQSTGTARDAGYRAQASADGSSEDAAIALAVQASLIEAQRATATSTNSDGQSAAIPRADAGRTLLSTLGDRAELERQRLERQRARGVIPHVSKPASAGIAAASSPNLSSKMGTSTNLPAAKVRAGPTDASGSLVASTSRAIIDSSPSSVSKRSHRFWKGAVKRVTNKYAPDDDSYSFADLVGPTPTLQSAIVSAYVQDEEWVLSHFPEATPVLLVQARRQGDTLPPLAVCALKPNSFRVIPPERLSGPYPGVMHTKLMVYYHSDFCRVIIPTANAIAYDWDVIDNALFVIDFPVAPRDDDDPFSNPTHTQFSRSFFQICYTLDVPKRFLVPAANYDYSVSKEVRLVHSTQGRYSLPDEEKKGGGIASLANAVQSFGFQPCGRWEIEATGSSIGRYTPAWLSQMLGACSGILPSTYFRSGKNNDVPREMPKPPRGQPVRLPIKIVFPTEDEIVTSFGGPGGGGTLFCGVKTWEASTFPRHLFHRGRSKRERVAAHTKTILALQKFPPSTREPEEHNGWMYLGSHNFTAAAWGRLENGSNGPTLTINNYELGVVIPIRAKSADELESLATEMVTYRRPLDRYGPGDRPWQQERFLP